MTSHSGCWGLGLGGGQNSTYNKHFERDPAHSVCITSDRSHHHCDGHHRPVVTSRAMGYLLYPRGLTAPAGKALRLPPRELPTVPRPGPICLLASGLHPSPSTLQNLIPRTQPLTVPSDHIWCQLSEISPDTPSGCLCSGAWRVSFIPSQWY